MTFIKGLLFIVIFCFVIALPALLWFAVEVVTVTYLDLGVERFAVYTLCIALVLWTILFNFLKRALHFKGGHTFLITVLIVIIYGAVGLYRLIDGLPVGVQHGRVVLLRYFCAVECPVSKSWYRVYYKVSQSACGTEAPGRPVIASTWGHYVGCTPE